jgi:hypothetical protein
MSGRVYLLGDGLALVALALGFTDWALSLQPGVTEANVKRIRTGMTLGQVEAILGPPGGTGYHASTWAIPGTPTVWVVAGYAGPARGAP